MFNSYSAAAKSRKRVFVLELFRSNIDLDIEKCNLLAMSIKIICIRRILLMESDPKSSLGGQRKK